MRVTVPTIHTGGTPVALLLEQAENAVNALRGGLEALKASGPNERDFPGRESVYYSARAEHAERLSKVRDVIAEMEAVWEQLQNQADLLASQKVAPR